MLLKGLVAFLVALLTALRVPTGAAAGDDSPVVTARLGISAGEAIADAELGTTGDALRIIIPQLWTAADQLGVSVETVSVGQGFFRSDDGLLESEKDLDLVVTGHRDSVEMLAAILRQAWDQSLVIIWYPQPERAEQATATIPLPAGAAQLTDEIYEAMAPEITDGAHVRYAGPDSLLFVAKTNDTESDAAFYDRMTRLAGILNEHGVTTGPIERGRADVRLVSADDYGAYWGSEALANAT
jgi:hypothetical protein